MLTLVFDSHSPYRLTLPRAARQKELLALARSFVQHEETLPQAERTPQTARLQTLLDQALPARLMAAKAESERKEASEALKRTEAQARRLVWQAHNMLTATFAPTPERAQAWGFVVRQTGRNAGGILLPQRRDELLNCLDSYIRMESARPEGERFVLPPLAEVTAARDALQTLLQSRSDSRRRRRHQTAIKNELCDEIREVLQHALAYLMITRCEGKLRPELEQWGFKLVGKPGRDGQIDDEAPTAEEAVPDHAAAPAAMSAPTAQPVPVSNGAAAHV